MLQYLPYAAGLVGALSVALFFWGLKLTTGEEQVAASGIPIVAKKQKDDESFILTRLSDLLGRPFTSMVLGLLGERGKTNVRRRIEAAGRPAGLTVEGYARRKPGDLILYGIPGILVFFDFSALLGFVLILYGLLMTDAMLFFQARRRQEKIQQMLPDFLDVLAVTVSAGLGFRHAVARVAESMPGPLSDEFNHALRQMELGTSRRDAFDDLRKRNSSEAVGQFVTALLQAEELGAPLSQALTEISVDMRRESAQWARRKAQKMNPQIVMVSTFVILPGLMLLIVVAMFYGSNINLGNLLGR